MHLQFLVSPQTMPYLNIAVENYLVDHQAPDTVTLYLWANRRTVVIGRHQNPYAEVNLDTLLADDGFLMRRGTGGGAVYHDDGNLNFSFIASHDCYDQSRQFAVLQRAVASFGLRTEVSGRNDVLCEGRKFSGNAFSRGLHNDLHHGTILIQSNMDDLVRYLRPKPQKLMKHGVSSVQSRVVNLADLRPDINATSIQSPLRQAFEQEYGLTATVLDWDSVVAQPEVQQLCAQFGSDEWLYGAWRTFTATRSAHFDWGDVDLAVRVENNRIVDVQVASDALDVAAIALAVNALRGADTSCPPVCSQPIASDIIALVYSK